jgi:hypothetical protein
MRGVGGSEGGEGEGKYRRHFRSMPNVFKKFGKYIRFLGNEEM